MRKRIVILPSDGEDLSSHVKPVIAEINDSSSQSSGWRSEGPRE